VSSVHSAPTVGLDPVILYRILQLRVDVFVVEQNCPYRELDGRDLEPTARQLWVQKNTEVAATLRVLTDPDGRARVGRVATATGFRGQGLAAALMSAAIALTGDADVVLDAQTYLAGWYARLGFAVDGPEFVEDGIPHVPMLLRRA